MAKFNKQLQQPIMKDVESSNIKSIGYLHQPKTLFVEFKSGACYKFLDVACDIADNLMNAKSKGKFFAENIKKKFVTIKMTEARKG